MLQLIARRSLHSQALAKSFGFCPLDIPKPAASPRGLTQLLESWIGNLHAVTELVWESPPQLPWNKELIVSPIPASEQDVGLAKPERRAAPGHSHTAGQELPLP